MEIVSERLSREFGLDLISTAPNVPYEVTAEDGTVHRVTNPSEFPDGKIKRIGCRSGTGRRTPSVAGRGSRAAVRWRGARPR